MINSFEVGTELGSDHLPVIVKMNTSSAEWTGPARRRNFNRTNWEEFQMELRTKISSHPIPNLENRDDIETEVSCITEALHTTISKCVPESSIERPLPPQIINLIKERRKLRRIFYTTSNDYFRVEANKLTKRIKKAIKDFETGKRNKICERIVEHSKNFQIKNFWNDTKALLNKKKADYIPTLIASDQSRSITDQEKANLLAKTLDSKMRPIPSNSEELKRAVNATVRDQLFYPLAAGANPTRSDPLEAPFTISDTTWELEHLRSDGAPGSDKIPNCVLKQGLEGVAIIRITNLFNACFRLGIFPSPWKHALVTMIPKPEKPPELPNSYRPISLTSCLGKLFEKLLVKRLFTHLEIVAALGSDQCAYRKIHSTYDNLCRLVQDAALAKCNAKRSAAIFLDVEAAFDSAWHDRLRHQMLQAGMPPMLLRILSDYLRDRKMQVRVNNSLSDLYPIQAGVPQGGILSPLLYLLYVSEMPTPTNPSVKRSQFADDMSIWATADTFDGLKSALQPYLKKIWEWCGAQGIKLNATKSQALCFNHKPSPRLDMRPKLKLGNVEIPYVEEARFLGLKLEPNQTMNKHILSMVKTCQSMTTSLARLANITRLSSETLKMLYRAYVESALTYGAPMLSNIAECHKHKLQVIQNRALRICYEIPSYISSDYIHQLARMPTINDRINTLSINWFNKVKLARLHRFHIRPEPLRARQLIKLPILHHLWNLTDRQNANRNRANRNDR